MKVLLFVLGGLAVLAGGFLLLSQYERKHPVVTDYRLYFENLPKSFDGFKILYFSDLHGSRFGRRDRAFRGKVGSLPADLYLFGGDMITVKRGKKDFSAVEDLLHSLRPEVPRYYGRGNHEIRMETRQENYPGWNGEFMTLLSENRVRVLENSSAEILRGTEKITVSSLEIPLICYGPGRKKELPDRYIEAKLGSPEGFRILLLHSPLYRKEAAEWGADLTLSGHFHGGTIYLGPLGGLMTPQYCFFSKDCRGVREDRGKYGVVSAGLGTHSVHVRIFNRPEVLAVTLIGKKHAD